MFIKIQVGKSYYLENGKIGTVDQKLLFQFGVGYIVSYKTDHGFRDSIILDCQGIHTNKSGFNVKRKI